MNSMADSRSDVGDVGADASAPVVTYLDSSVFEDVFDRTVASTINGVINTTLASEDDLAQSSGLSVLFMDSSVESSATTATASSALILGWPSLMVAAALSVIVLLTICGNLLILAAVLFNSNLRGPTHILIANLAVADLLLGFLVLPFSATLEVTGNWYFGAVFCDVWAAVDVLCCTASIMSLCVISVDRYIGVTRPLNYYSIVTAQRSTVLCVIVWISSLSISIGPLLGWKERSDFSSATVSDNNDSLVLLPTTFLAATSDYAADQQACNVNKEKGYVLFSAIGSFYLPTLVILAVYWRIYRAAVKQTKFLESGTKTDKSTSSLSSEVLTLRVHVGRSTPMKPVASVGHSNNHHVHVVKGRSSVSRSSFAVEAPANSVGEHRSSSRKNNRNSRASQGSQQTMPSPPALDIELAKDLDEATGAMMRKSLAGSHLVNNMHHPQRRGSRRPSSTGSTSSTPAAPSASAASAASGTASSTGLSAKMFKFRRQKKAAKTLGIVVGAFLLCWFPFFVILPVEALCSTCGIPSPLFSCCFWLGYCNSCLNPFIYASTSREFKRAFSKILCGRRGTSSGAAGRSINHQQQHLLPPPHRCRNSSVGNISPALGNRDAPVTPSQRVVDQCPT